MVSPHWGEVWGYPENLLFLGSRNAYFGAFSDHSECLLLHCTSTSRPRLRLTSLTFQTDCGSVKVAEVPAEESTEHYLPWC